MITLRWAHLLDLSFDDFFILCIIYNLKVIKKINSKKSIFLYVSICFYMFLYEFYRKYIRDVWKIYEKCIRDVWKIFEKCRKMYEKCRKMYETLQVSNPKLESPSFVLMFYINSTVTFFSPELGPKLRNFHILTSLYH